jgi:hypothetical protein
MRENIVKYAVELLNNIHSATSDHGDRIWESTSTEVLYSLLDLIMIEGVLPFLSPGVGLPVRLRPASLLVEHLKLDPIDSCNTTTELMNGLLPLLQDRKRPITAILRERYLGDLIAVTAELSQHCQSKAEQQKWETLLNQVIEQ